MKHLGIIPDGNRRWARINETTNNESYRIGLEKVLLIIDTAIKFGFSEFSIYCLSKENYKRNNEDLEAVYNAEADFLEKKLYDYVLQNNIQVYTWGDFVPLPQYFMNAINKITNFTPKQPRIKINLLIGYSPIDEILNTIKLNPQNEEDLKNNLWVKSNIDFLIRTGGGNVPLSNFLPLQCGYASVKIFDTFLNDLRIEEIENYLIEYLKQQKMYGR